MRGAGEGATRCKHMQQTRKTCTHGEYPDATTQSHFDVHPLMEQAAARRDKQSAATATTHECCRRQPPTKLTAREISPCPPEGAKRGGGICGRLHTVVIFDVSLTQHDDSSPIPSCSVLMSSGWWWICLRVRKLNSIRFGLQQKRNQFIHPQIYRPAAAALRYPDQSVDARGSVEFRKASSF